ncbi:MAG: hypothetical protein A3J83_00240 [Elusimicrobia bacterium RIFOXYA2_FULL_40_6]|nr:MAG: hypothetical protein A3J83_00240 [Elusimicrobia bacterium RIFOXYA2_FULL_40_6]
MKNLIKSAIFVFIAGVFASSIAQGISVTSIQTLNSAYMPATNFSNTETITLKIDCYSETNAATISFKFYIYDPNGRQVFYHEGNSMPGKIGTGGAELRNIPIDFYSKPGNYTFRGEATADGISVYNTTAFAIASQNISLVFPPRGIRDILAQPLMFQWSGSGATKYRVTVGDNAGFYKPIWTGESYITQIEYPKDPTDAKAKLASGTVYYWKVDGLDAMGRVVAETQSPFDFTIKDTNIDSSDLGVLDIITDETSTEEVLMLDVVVKNLGSKAESNVNIDLVIVGGNVVPTQSISSIQAGETKNIVFNCGSVSGAALTVSATLNMFDDNPRNNTLTKVIKLVVKEKAKILGGVTYKNAANKTVKNIADASIVYSGPVNGTVKTNNGGQYKIENLLLGEYVLKATHPDYKDSELITVKVDKNKAFANIDFVLELKEADQEKPKEKKNEQIAVPELTPQDMLAVVQDLIKDKKVVNDFEGFSLVQIELEPAGSIQATFQQLKNRKASIISYTVEEEKE